MCNLSSQPSGNGPSSSASAPALGAAALGKLDAQPIKILQKIRQPGDETNKRHQNFDYKFKASARYFEPI